MPSPYVTASEIADYVYCRCCWADKIEGNYQETEEMVAGMKAHEKLHWSYQTIQFIKQVSLIVVIGCAVLLVLFIILLYLSGELL